MISRIIKGIQRLDWWKATIVLLALGLVINFSSTAIDEVKAKMFPYQITVGTQAAAATPDYTTDGIDDDVQIQAALTALPAAGGEVLLLTGTYNISNPITISTSGVVLKGLSKYATTIDATGVPANYAIRVDGVGDVNGVGLESLRILNANSGLLLDRATIGSFRDLIVSGSLDVGSIGISLNSTGGSAYYNHFENVDVEVFDIGTYLSGSGVNVPTDNVFTGLRNAGNLGDGLLLELGIYNVFINPRSSNNGGDGYDIRDSSNTLVVPYSEGNTGFGYRISDNYNTLVGYHATGNIAGSITDSGTRTVKWDSGNVIDTGNSGTVWADGFWFSQLNASDWGGGISYIDAYDSNGYTVELRARNTNVALQSVARLSATPNPTLEFMQPPDWGQSATRVISAGAIDLNTDTANENAAWLIIDTEGAAASDNLTTINYADVGSVVICSPANDARTIIFQSGVGNFLLDGGADFTADNTTDTIMLAKLSSSWWVELSRSNN